MLTEKQSSTSPMSGLQADAMVLGLGGTVDYEIVWDNATFQSLVDSYGITLKDLSKSIVIESEREMICNIVSHFQDSCGGEIQVSSSEIVKTFSNRFEKRITLGGTGVRAAIAMKKFGQTTTQHLVSIDDNVRNMLPEGTKYICSADSDSLDPHLIIQFDPRAVVRVENTVISPLRADRLILTCDPPNEILKLSNELPRVLTTASIFLISGFNSIHEKSLLELRLQEIEEYSKSCPKEALIFFEDAGYHRPEFRTIVMAAISKLATFYSMNEEELQKYLQRDVNYLDAKSVVAALSDISSLIDVPILVIHTKYYSVILGKDYVKYVDCMISGMTMATTRYIHGDNFTVSEFEAVGASPKNILSLSIESEVNRQIAGWGCLLPAFEVTCESPTTIGLGDTFVGGFLLELAEIMEHSLKKVGQ